MREVKVRDEHQCLCCGVNRRLTVHHISPSYYGGKNHFKNLQTLCGVCNRLSGTDYISFRNHQTTLTSAPAVFPWFRDKMPTGRSARSCHKWERYLRVCINFFYRCAAVERIEIGGRGDRFWQWGVWLFQGNPPEWLAAYLPSLAEEIREVRAAAGSQAAPESVDILG